MNVLITGGTTFVSKYAAEYFINRGDRVSVLNRGSRAQVEGAEHIRADRLNLEGALEGRSFDTVLDITAYTAEDIRALLLSGASFKDYVFISSSAVYPDTAPQPFTEETPCGENSVWGSYGINKLEAERYLSENEPGAYILRPPYFYGKYDNLYREAFVFDCAMKDRPFYIPGEGNMRLQFYNVADLCRFIEILLTKRPSDRVFNVGNPETVTVREWVELCYRAAGRKVELRSVDKLVPQREYFPFYDYEYVLDVSRQAELMLETTPVEKGLTEEFKWYKLHPESVYRRRPYIDFIDKNLR